MRAPTRPAKPGRITRGEGDEGRFCDLSRAGPSEGEGLTLFEGGVGHPLRVKLVAFRA
ncbi:PIN family toxin-antitoxin system [Schaalia cardiffensis F0333]|uniref:PIN family toxin-antitoxin system n=1 Tax=Schaalia cardiffensis F0333 TaxID=888050 RepID=N6XCR0_9ACTO|nr:PIN family toxin-antitoxin system [Schaalia cardiffensis F0333]